MEISADITDLKKVLRTRRYQEKTDRTLGYCTPAWLDDIFVLTRGNKQDYEKKLFDVLKKNWKKPSIEQIKINQNS